MPPIAPVPGTRSRMDDESEVRESVGIAGHHEDIVGDPLQNVDLSNDDGAALRRPGGSCPDRRSGAPGRRPESRPTWSHACADHDRAPNWTSFQAFGWVQLPPGSPACPGAPVAAHPVVGGRRATRAGLASAGHAVCGRRRPASAGRNGHVTLAGRGGCGSARRGPRQRGRGRPDPRGARGRVRSLATARCRPR